MYFALSKQGTGTAECSNVWPLDCQRALLLCLRVVEKSLSFPAFYSAPRVNALARRPHATTGSRALFSARSFPIVSLMVLSEWPPHLEQDEQDSLSVMLSPLTRVFYCQFKSHICRGCNVREKNDQPLVHQEIRSIGLELTLVECGRHAWNSSSHCTRCSMFLCSFSTDVTTSLSVRCHRIIHIFSTLNLRRLLSRKHKPG